MGKSLGKHPLGRSRRRCDDNVKRDRKKISGEDQRKMELDHYCV
jgi:hypothetical protein